MDSSIIIGLFFLCVWGIVLFFVIRAYLKHRGIKKGKYSKGFLKGALFMIISITFINISFMADGLIYALSLILGFGMMGYFWNREVFK